MSDETTGLVQAMQALWGGAATSLAGAAVGRLMYHSLQVRARRRRFLGPELLWEVPVAVGMAVIGEGVASYFGWEPQVRTAVIAVLAYLGPRGAAHLLDRWLDKRGADE